MEITGTGGIVLVIIAVLWLGFLTPTGKRGLGEATKRRKRIQVTRNESQISKPNKKVEISSDPAWFEAPRAVPIQETTVVEPKSEKVVVNRLPDPLSARLGKIESVKWAEVHELDNLRKEKENLTSESLDEILRRRRSNE